MLSKRDQSESAGQQVEGEATLTLLPPFAVAHLIQEAHRNQSGFALIRRGDGELLTLAQDNVLTISEVIAAGGHFLPYAGVNVPDLQARDRVLSAVFAADLVGVPESQHVHFQPLFQRIAKYYHIPLQAILFTSSLVNYDLETSTNIYQELLAEGNVVLVGNRTPELKKQLEDAGYPPVVGTVPVAGVQAVDAVLQQLSQIKFEVAFVSAGIAATILCAELKRWGKIALDFGHLADLLIQEKRDFRRL